MLEGTGEILFLQINIPNLYPKLLHPVRIYFQVLQIDLMGIINNPMVLRTLHTVVIT